MLTTVVGWILGYSLAGSIIPIPDWLIRRMTDDPRAELAGDLALTIGKAWGGLQGGFFGFVVGIALSLFIWSRNRHRI